MTKEGDVRSGPDLRLGDEVVLQTRDTMIARFGRGLRDLSKIKTGKLYTITNIEVHDYHTLIWVDGGEGEEIGPYNEALFRHVP